VASFGIVSTADFLEQRMTLHPKHKEWIEARGIEPHLAEAFGLETRKDSGAAWLVVPYLDQGEVVNHKWRLTGEKRHKMDSGAPLLLWNADVLRTQSVREGKVPVVITEGEWDALAAIQSGCSYTVSVPNGAPAQVTANLDEAKRYDWVDRHASDLAGVREFIIAADGDEAGANLRTDLVALLGAGRCKFVEYPEGCKDLNDVLLKHGQEGVAACVMNAKPFPVQGLYRVSDFPERGQVRSYDCGVEPLEDYLKVVPGTLTVLTGYANMGKSTLMNQIIAYQICCNFPVCVASFETDVKPILVNGIAGAILKCDPWDVAKHEGKARAMGAIESGLCIISQSVEEDLEMDLDKFLELCRIAVVRHGVKMVVLDPWNELEHKRRRDETETDYIGRAIRAIKRFAKLNDVAFWVVAHPTKPHEGVKKVPGLYDISGSANWANKADYGLTYHRPNANDNYAKVLISKVRMGLPGKRDTVELQRGKDGRFEPYTGGV
jgi:twinkle protein